MNAQHRLLVLTHGARDRPARAESRIVHQEVKGCLVDALHHPRDVFVATEICRQHFRLGAEQVTQFRRQGSESLPIAGDEHKVIAEDSKLARELTPQPSRRASNEGNRTIR
jgi:hypothetical protein